MTGLTASMAGVAAAMAFVLLTRPRPRPGPRRSQPIAPTRRFRLRRRRPVGPNGSIRAGDVALTADLVVAALEAGVPLWVAIDAAGQAVGDELGEVLSDVRRRQEVGSDAVTATATLVADPATARMGRAFRRAATSGASPVQVLAGAADSERDRRRSNAVSKARSAGALAALPVGLLFLPAFVLVAVVPVVVGSLSAMLGSG